VTNEISADTTIQPLRFMVDSGEGRDHDSSDRILQRRGAAEFIGMVFHGYSITHIDTPAHYFWQGKMYNGRSANLITSREGAQVESVDLLRDGVVSRGVLLDVAALKGRWLEAGEGVMPEDLEAAEKAQGVRVEPGDILLIRTGYYARRLREPRNPGRDGSPAAGVASMPWFRARDIAMLGTDTHNDVSPLSHPTLGNVVHIVGLQPGGAGRGVRVAPALGVPAHRRAAASAAHDGLAGQPDRVVLIDGLPRATGATPIRDLTRARTASSVLAVR
jgi:kynurenine formamidase